MVNAITKEEKEEIKRQDILNKYNVTITYGKENLEDIIDKIIENDIDRFVEDFIKSCETNH